MESKQRWQDWVNLALGIWLFVAPFVGLSMLDTTAAWNSYIFGAIIAVLAATALRQPQRWEEWTNLVIGLWLIVAPFVLGFGTQTAAMWNHVVVGIIVGGDALWAALARPPEQPHHA
jgi:hypothetical protein